MEALPPSPLQPYSRGNLEQAFDQAEALCSRFEAHFKHEGPHDEMSPLNPGTEGVVDILFALETSFSQALLSDQLKASEVNRVLEILTYFITDIRIDLGPCWSSILNLLYFLELLMQKGSRPDLKVYAGRVMALKLFLEARSARTMITRLMDGDQPHYWN